MAIYYTDPNSGVDYTNDGSLGSPWKTLGYAFTQVVGADTIKMKAGTYYENNLVLSLTNIAIEAYTGADVYVDGGYPITSFDKVYPDSGRQWGAILRIIGNENTVKNIVFQNSEGRAIHITGDENLIQYCTVKQTASQSLAIDAGAGGNTVDHCSSYRSSMKGRGGAIEIQGYSAVGNNVIQYCSVYQSRGEGIGTTNATNVEIIGNTVWDCVAGLYNIDTTVNATIEKNVGFQTDSWRANTSYYPAGIVLSNEVYTHIDQITNNIVIKNNIIVNTWKSMLFRTGWVYDSDGSILLNPDAGFKNFSVVNNTFINGENEGIHWNCAGSVPQSSHEPCVFANNIIIQDGASVVSFSQAVPGGEPDACITKWTFSNNLWTSSPGTTITSKDGNQIIDSTPSLGDTSGTDYQTSLTTAGDFDRANYKLYTGSQAIEGGSATYAPSDDHFGTTRPAGTYDDIGAHEYGDPEVVFSAGFSLSDTTPNSGDLVIHSDDSTISAGLSITRVKWTFSDDTISNLTAPEKVYTTLGAHSLTYEIWDDTNGHYDIAYESTALTVGNPSSFKRSLVEFDAGTTVIAHGLPGGETPAAILFIMNEATSDVDITTPTGIVSDAFICIGMWAADNDAELWSACYQPDGESSKLGESKGGSGNVLKNPWTNMSAAISSVNGTNINLTWSGTTSNQQCAALVFGGAAVESANAYAHTVSDSVTTEDQTSDANLLIMPTSMTTDSWHAFMSLGFAVKDEGQVCGGINLSRSAGPRTRAQSDKIGWHSFYDGGLGASFGTGQYTITLSPLPSSSFSYTLPVLALELTGVKMSVGIVNTPTSDSEDNRSETFDPGTMIAVLTNVGTVDSTISDATAGFFGVYLGDGSGGRSFGFHSKVGANPTNDGQYTDSGYAHLDDGAGAGELMQGDISFGPLEYVFDMDTGKSDSTARKIPMLLLEDVPETDVLTSKGLTSSGKLGLPTMNSMEADPPESFGELIQSKDGFVDANLPQGYITLSFDFDPQPGSLLVAAHYSGDGTITQPVGWLAAFWLTQPIANDEGGLYYKIAGLNEPREVTVQSALPNEHVMVIAEFSGPYADPPFDVEDHDLYSEGDEPRVLDTVALAQIHNLVIGVAAGRRQVYVEPVLSGGGFSSGFTEVFISGSNYKWVDLDFKRIASSDPQHATWDANAAYDVGHHAGIAVFKALVSEWLMADGLGVGSMLGTPTLGQVHNLEALGLESLAEIDIPELGQEHQLIPDGLFIRPSLRSPTLPEAGGALSVKVQSKLGKPSISQTHILIASGVKSTAVLDLPTPGQVYVLSADGLTSLPSLDSPILTHIHALGAIPLVGSSELGRPVLEVIPRGMMAVVFTTYVLRMSVWVLSSNSSTRTERRE